MKTLAFLFIFTLNQAVQPSLAPDFIMNEEITEELKFEILDVVKTTIYRYQTNGNFWDEDLGQFDNDKYLDFIKLFGGSAEIVDDLAFTDKMLPYPEYAQLIFDNLQEIGVPFNLEKVEIQQIDIDDGGYYIVDLNMTKRIFSGLNQNGKPVKLKSGRKIELKVRIDLPSYFLEDARIQYIKMKEPKKFAEYLVQPVIFVNNRFKRN